MSTALLFISTAEATDIDCNNEFSFGPSADGSADGANTISVTSPPIVVPPNPAKLPIKAAGLAKLAVKTKEKIKNKEAPKGYLVPNSRICLKIVQISQI